MLLFLVFEIQNAMRTSLPFFLFCDTVGNLLAAQYNLDLNVKEMAIIVRTLKYCEKVTKSNCSSDRF